MRNDAITRDYALLLDGEEYNSAAEGGTVGVDVGFSRKENID